MINMSKELSRGAEALLTVENNNVVKERIKKSYRVPELDKRLRTERTRAEARLINEAARAGVLVPKILETNEKENKITMELIEGEQVKNAIPKMGKKELESLAFNIGTSIGKLHSAGLIHGDLTTSNMILHDKRFFLIDFGLGTQSAHPEDQGTDLAVLHEALCAAHLKQLDILWKGIIEAYKKEFSGSDKVLKALHSIEMRGRYMKRGE